ncbi:MAG TPA: M20/M25/M40 family metallo-hydrolase, partial [Thermoplasmata archaeon]|nr:M20/M25/M40 family metallo-hydrolase [Thermoplasmata archaeon]
PAPAAERLGDRRSLELLSELVAIAPTNLEDLARDRFEKPNYRRAADAIVRAARANGLATRLFDPLETGDVADDLRGLPRPNVIADLDVGAAETVLVMAHFDVVPVPTEQRSRWKSPPHSLTERADGRLYGRGANDDLGSGVVASLLALRRLADAGDAPRNVRLLACCDEETGGEGGIEALRAHDAKLPPGSPERFLTADVALIPDGSPETTIGSSGLAFLEASFGGRVPLAETIAYGQALVDLHELARGWKSAMPSPDWPSKGAPEPVITGRATVTRFDVGGVAPASTVRLTAAHAETDAGNQVARSVTLVFEGPAAGLAGLAEGLRPLVPPPFVLEPTSVTSLVIPPGAVAVSVIGTATHGGYPHRGHNPVPPALDLLRRAAADGAIDARSTGAATFTVDLRFTPEMELDDGLRQALGRVDGWIAAHAPSARIEAPPARCRAGYALPAGHPAAVKLDRILQATMGAHGFRGEYGGTDASSLRGLTTPRGAPLPALVFGSMDDAAHIHDAEESVDPTLLAGVAAAIERFVREP